ncbi:hypothetical protein HK102_004890, partial [Quaeritorhiza haematococci]
WYEDVNESQGTTPVSRDDPGQLTPPPPEDSTNEPSTPLSQAQVPPTSEPEPEAEQPSQQSEQEEQQQEEDDLEPIPVVAASAYEELLSRYDALLTENTTLRTQVSSLTQSVERAESEIGRVLKLVEGVAGSGSDVEMKKGGSSGWDGVTGVATAEVEKSCIEVRVERMARMMVQMMDEVVRLRGQKGEE